MARAASHDFCLERDGIVRVVEYGTYFSVGHAFDPGARADFLARGCAQPIRRGSGAGYPDAEKLSGPPERIDEPH